MRAWTRRFVLALLLPLAACDGDSAADAMAGTGPVAGTLAVTVASPFGNDGAISFDLTGPEISRVRGEEGVQAFVTPIPSGFRVAAMAGSLDGVVVLFDVADVRVAENYRATVLEAADTDNQLRRDVSGYRMEVQSR